MHLQKGSPENQPHFKRFRTWRNHHFQGNHGSTFGGVFVSPLVILTVSRNRWVFPTIGAGPQNGW